MPAAVDVLEVIRLAESPGERGQLETPRDWGRRTDLQGPGRRAAAEAEGHWGLGVLGVRGRENVLGRE